MAITKTTTFNFVSSYPAEDTSGADNLNSTHPKLCVVETIVFDDASDDTLPVSNQIKRWIGKYSDEDTSTLTVLTSEDSLVQTIAAEIWA